LLKKVNITISNRRKQSDLFARVRDVFERKFDGFPAVPADPSGKLAGYTSGDLGVLDTKTIIDTVADLKQSTIPDSQPCSDSPCLGSDVPSGTTCFNELSTVDHITFTPSVPAKYYVSVVIDGSQAIIGVDYSVVSGNIVVQTALSPDVIVTARYVAA
jgi:hypothetical protein